MYSDIAANKQKTIIIMAVFILFVGLIDFGLDWYFGGGRDLFLGIIVASLIYALITYYSGSRLALAVNGAQEIGRQDNPRLWKIVENLSITDGLPMPRVYVINDPAPNAFATGRDPRHSAVCVTSGILEIMDDTEMQGVLAHELGHVKNYDIRVSMVTFALTAVISLIADILLRLSWFGGDDRDNNNNNQMTFFLGLAGAILAPLVATMIQLAISRQREYLADATSALTTRYPEGLISALRKIEQTGSTMRKQNTATAHLFFANPLRGHSITNLFSTHPPIADRIARLQSMGTRA